MRQTNAERKAARVAVFGTRIRALREALGNISQQELAARLHVALGTVSAWEQKRQASNSQLVLDAIERLEVEVEAARTQAWVDVDIEKWGAQPQNETEEKGEKP